MALAVVATGCAAEAPEPAAESGIGGWTVTAESYGAVRIGMPVDEASAVLDGRLQLPDTLGDECTMLALAADSPDVLFMAVGRRVVRLDVRDSAVTTAAGARIGDSNARVGRLYGSDRVMATPHAYSDGVYLTVVPRGTGDEHRLVFESDGETVTEYRAGILPMVGWVEGCS